MNIENRIRKIEKVLTPCGKGRCFLNIWDDLSNEQWAELAEWAMGDTDKRPDFWPSEEHAIELKQQGYSVQTRDELREIYEMLIETNKRAMEAGDGIDWKSINGQNHLNG